MVVGRHHEVVGLEVAVHDPGGVRLGERARDLRGNLQRPARRKRPARHQLSHRLPLDQLHADVRLAVDLTELVDGHDGGMIQRRRGTRLGFESTETILIAAEIRRQELERHVALQREVACSIHLAHAARAEV